MEHVQPRMLIVDDDEAHVRALCDTLGERGYEVAGYADVRQALSVLQTEPFDIFLVDLAMPAMDGIAAVQAAREIDANLACIIMTGEGTISSAVQAMQIGALDYVTKPFKVSAILPILARALETRQLRLKNAELELQLRAHVAELSNLNKDLDLAKRQAERNSEEKATFISNMSHELRTPLNTVVGFAQILVDETLALTLYDRKDFAKDILQAGRHLLTLINEILDLAKVESGNINFSMEAVALGQIFIECKTIIEPLANKRGIRIRYPEKTDALVLADRARLKQVLINLLSNAVKYNRQHGSVIVAFYIPANGLIRISVRDIGLGLDAKQLEGIFLPFNRLGRKSSGEEGTGIGLALTKRIVESMQGKIGVSSTPGVGSVFWIDIPVFNFGAPLVRVPAEESFTEALDNPAPWNKKKLLYVENNPANLKLVTELIRLRFDLNLLSAPDGKRGIELAREHLPQLILIDINMPGINGFETRRILREDPKTAHIPVIAVAASVMSHEIKKAQDADFFRYITKPIDITALIEAIESALRLGAEGEGDSEGESEGDSESEGEGEGE